MKKNNKLIILIIPLLILFFVLGKTFGLFEAKVDLETNLDVAKWQIKVNGDVVTGDDATFEAALTTDSDENVVEGKFAPGSESYFEIEIDPNDTEVAFRYDITLDFSSLDNDQIQLVSITPSAGLVLTQTGENTYSSIVTLSDIENDRIDTLRVTFEWVNDEDNNEIDYETQKNGGGVTVPVEVHFEQYLGGTLEAYTG